MLLSFTLIFPLIKRLRGYNFIIYCVLVPLQISEVVNSMKDLIDYSRETRTGPMGKFCSFMFLLVSAANLRFSKTPS